MNPALTRFDSHPVELPDTNALEFSGLGASERRSAPMLWARV